MAISEHELEKRTTQRIKDLKKGTKIKREYLDYYKQRKQKGEKPNTYAGWLKLRKMGGSRQLREGVKGLSSADAAEVARILGRK